MNCSKCGGPLIGNESTCPNCGNPIVNVVNNEPELLEEEPEILDEKPVNVEPTIEEVKEEKPKSNKLLLIIIIILVVLAACAAVLLFVFSSKPAKPTNKDKEVKEKLKTETYAGYTFIIPKGYTATNDPKYGLMISDSRTIFTISIDYSHKYEEYKTTLTTKYPDQADKLVANVEGREYLALILTEEEGGQATEYISKGSNTTTFVGMVARSDYKTPTTIEFTKLTEILDKSKSDSNTINPGDENDAGKKGEKIYSFTRKEFTFKK